MKKIDFTESDRIRMEPDCYAGEQCDLLRPRWIVGVEKEGDVELGAEFRVSAKHFPPGTRLIIECPRCPDCGESSDMLAPMEFEGSWPDCDCGFSWADWARDQYE